MTLDRGKKRPSRANRKTSPVQHAVDTADAVAGGDTGSEAGDGNAAVAAAAAWWR